MTRESNRTAATPHIYLIGAGLEVPDHLTIQACRALAECRAIFAYGVDVAAWRDAGLPEFEDVTLWLDKGTDRSVTYERIARSVVDEGARRSPVGFVTYGSVTVGMAATHRIRELASAAGLSLQTLWGVSFLEGIWDELAIDPLMGCQVWEASWFLAREANPDTHAHFILTGVGVLGISAGIATEASNLETLGRRLLKAYPPSHPAKMIHLPAFGKAGELWEMKIANIAELRLKPGLQSLVIPPLLIE